MATEAALQLPAADVEYRVQMGHTMSSSSSKNASSFRSLRYDFKPASVSRSAPGVLLQHPADGPKVSMYLPNNSSGELDVHFQGRYEPSKDDLECVAIFDGTGFRLECLSGQIKARHIRDARPYQGGVAADSGYALTPPANGVTMDEIDVSVPPPVQPRHVPPVPSSHSQATSQQQQQQQRPASNLSHPPPDPAPPKRAAAAAHRAAAAAAAATAAAAAVPLPQPPPAAAVAAAAARPPAAPAPFSLRGDMRLGMKKRPAAATALAQQPQSDKAAAATAATTPPPQPSHEQPHQQRRMSLDGEASMDVDLMAALEDAFQISPAGASGVPPAMLGVSPPAAASAAAAAASEPPPSRSLSPVQAPPVPKAAVPAAVAPPRASGTTRHAAPMSDMEREWQDSIAAEMEMGEGGAASPIAMDEDEEVEEGEEAGVQAEEEEEIEQSQNEADVRPGSEDDEADAEGTRGVGASAMGQSPAAAGEAAGAGESGRMAVDDGGHELGRDDPDSEEADVGSEEDDEGAALLQASGGPRPAAAAHHGAAATAAATAAHVGAGVHATSSSGSEGDDDANRCSDDVSDGVGVEYF